MRLLLVGHGRMGKLIETLAPQYGCEIVGALDSTNNPDGQAISAQSPGFADVAVDFSTASAVCKNLRLLAERRIDVVLGTTGWQQDDSECRRIVAEAEIGVVVGSNFSLGVNVFQSLVERAAFLFNAQPNFGSWIHEVHHAAKRDAPSGTALTLKTAMEQAGYARVIDVASSRAGSVPGTHTVGFDGPFETVTLTHAARDRATFAHGALEAARWIHGRQGWFTIRQLLGLEEF